MKKTETTKVYLATIRTQIDRFRKKTTEKNPTQNERGKNPHGKKPQGNKPPLDCQKDVNSIKINSSNN